MKPLKRLGLAVLALTLSLTVMATYCRLWPLHIAAAWLLVSVFGVFWLLLWSLSAEVEA